MSTVTTDLETYFTPFRNNIIGIDGHFTAKDGRDKKVVYADWIASGRLYKPIEEKLSVDFGAFSRPIPTHTRATPASALPRCTSRRGSLFVNI
ncbi:MAG: hypothetical protein U5L96_03975 [Owenweeksia sp.]|nr:hypothetical protein [Owenweeksia sp.]